MRRLISGEDAVMIAFVVLWLLFIFMVYVKNV